MGGWFSAGTAPLLGGRLFVEHIHEGRPIAGRGVRDELGILVVLLSRQVHDALGVLVLSIVPLLTFAET